MTRRARRGDIRRPLTARDRSRFAEAADHHETAQRPRDTSSPPDFGLCFVSNETGSQLPARSVVALKEPAVATIAGHADGPGQIPEEFETRFRSRDEWTGDDDSTFDLARYWNRYAITRQSANPGALAPAIYKGRALVTLTVRNRRHEYAEPDPDDRELFRSAWHGTPIRWIEDLSATEAADVDSGSTVEKLAAIYLDPQPGICVVGYLETALAPATAPGGTLAPTTATIRVWTDHPDDGWSKAGTEDSALITLTNRDETLDVDAGILIRARSDGKIWEPDWISCVASLVDRS